MRVNTRTELYLFPEDTRFVLSQQRRHAFPDAALPHRQSVSAYKKETPIRISFPIPATSRCPGLPGAPPAAYNPGMRLPALPVIPTEENILFQSAVTLKRCAFRSVGVGSISALNTDFSGQTPAVFIVHTLYGAAVDAGAV